MLTSLPILSRTQPPFATALRRRSRISVAAVKPRSVRRTVAVREPSAIDLAAVFAGFRVAQVYVGHAAGSGT